MSPQQSDTIIGIVVIGVLFACIWAAAWIVSKILMIPVVLWRKAFQKEIVVVPLASATSDQNDLESFSLETRQSNPIVPESLESKDIVEARFPRQTLERQPKNISPIIRTD